MKLRTPDESQLRTGARATYADLLAIPDHKVVELIDGELFVNPRPASPHARASSRLGGELYGPFDRGRGGPGGWIILDEPELHFGDDVLVPDLAGWRTERFPPDGPSALYFTVAPDWVCEVVSPSTGRLDRVRKSAVYAHVSVTYFWLIDPLERTLEVSRLTDSRWLQLAVHSNDDRVHAEPFQEFELELAALWW